MLTALAVLAASVVAAVPAGGDLRACERTARAAAVEPGAGTRYLISRTSAKDLALAITAPIDRRVVDDPSLERVLGELNRGQQAVYALFWVEGEVEDGGFDQLFFNSNGALVHEAILGARLLGARPFEQLLCRAAALFPRGRVPKDRRERQRARDRMGSRGDAVLAAIDDRFFALEESRRTYLGRYYARYVEAHPREFFR